MSGVVGATQQFGVWCMLCVCGWRGSLIQWMNVTVSLEKEGDTEKDGEAKKTPVYLNRRTGAAQWDNPE